MPDASDRQRRHPPRRPAPRASRTVPPSIMPVPRARLRHTLTFAELDTHSGQLARGLDEIGIRRGMRTVLMVPPVLEFFALTFALFKVGAVPVLIDPAWASATSASAWPRPSPRRSSASRRPTSPGGSCGWAERHDPHHGHDRQPAVRRPAHRFANSEQIGEQARPAARSPTRAADETAAILFTSGSTGVAKGAVYTHGIFAAQVEYSETDLRHRAGRDRPVARSRCSPCSPRPWA